MISKLNNNDQAIQYSLNKLLYSNSVFIIYNFLEIINSLNTSLNLLKIIIDFIYNNNSYIIATSTSYDLDIYKNKNFINKYFRIMLISELSIKEVKNILNYKSKEILEKYNIIIKDENINKIILLSEKYLSNLSFPYKALYLLDSVVSENWINKINLDSKVSLNSSLNSFINKLSNSNNFFNEEENRADKILKLKTKLLNSIINQDKAIISIINKVQSLYSGIKNDNKPVGSWLFWGSSGTGKTELIKVLAKELFLNKNSIIRLDMSEYMEKHSSSKIIGSPPGYVGHDSGGSLTEQVKNNPFSIILFDEIEKAHPDISNLLLQVLDEGHLTDSKGIKISFSNWLVFFTSNLGCSYDNMLKSYNKLLDIKDTVLKEINSFFKPEFINRLDDIIIFNSLTVDSLKKISKKFVKEFNNNLKKNKININIIVKEEVYNLLSNMSFSILYGARPLKRLCFIFIEKPINNIILNCKIKNNIHITINVKNKKIIYSINKIFKFLFFKQI